MTPRKSPPTTPKARGNRRSKTSDLELILEMSDFLGPDIWTTMNVTHESVPDVFIKTLFMLLSLNPTEVSRLVVWNPERLSVLNELQSSISERIHVGVDLSFGNEPSRIDALRKVPVSVKFIRCDQIDDLAGIDLSGIDYVVAGGCRHHVKKNGAIQKFESAVTTR